MEECFTCKNKQSRELTKEERKELNKLHFEKTGRYTLLIPEMEFKCGISGKIISQIDHASEKYEGDELLVDIRKSLSDTARKLRKELNNPPKQ